MDTRVALIGIIVEEDSSVAALNELLHAFAYFRLGGASIVSACIHLLFSAFGSRFGSALRRRRNDHAVIKE